MSRLIGSVLTTCILSIPEAGSQVDNTVHTLSRFRKEQCCNDLIAYSWTILIRMVVWLGTMIYSFIVFHGDSEILQFLTENLINGFFNEKISEYKKFPGLETLFLPHKNCFLFYRLLKCVYILKTVFMTSFSTWYLHFNTNQIKLFKVFLKYQTFGIFDQVQKQMIYTLLLL